MITRYFHPVGQGAFYSERHANYNIVYDCGELYNRKGAKEVVKNAFRGEDIDILFISHFDFDHISLIDTLKENNNIKNVVVPLTTPKGKALSIASCLRSEKTIPSNLLRLITSPQQFFGESTKVIQVSIIDNGNELISNGEPITIEQQDTTINSGTILTTNKNNDPTDTLESNWCFIPYNIQFDIRAKELCDKLTKANLQYNKLTDLQYIKDNLPDIKRCYDSLPDGANGNSMILYSGPFRNFTQSEHHIMHYVFPQTNHLYRQLFISYEIACLYTGDVNLKNVNMNNINSPFKDFIGTIQIPHHGSLLSFDNNNFLHKRMITPISFGNNNSFGHPSAKVLDYLLKDEVIPVSITNDMNSTFIQVIK